jgi:tryptophan synthase alpha chain
MMSDRYKRRFAQIAQDGRKAFIPFTLLGWPSAEASLEIARTMIESGATALELGWAFSDPIADGPVIQAAAFETLASGFKVTDALDLIAQIRGLDAEIPIGLLVYYNMVLVQGIDSFFRLASESGVDGVLIADLPADNSDEVKEAATKYGIDLIFIVSPLTSDERLGLILRNAGGFIYGVSRLGITGTHEKYDEHLSAMIQRVRSQTDLPLCLGFGISTPEQARKMLDLGADGVITGSRVIELVDALRPESPSSTLRTYLDTMVAEVSR